MRSAAACARLTGACGPAGGHQKRSGNCYRQNHNECGFVCAHLRISSPRKNFFQSLLSPARTGHRDTLPSNATRCSTEIFKKSQEHPCVAILIGPARQHFFIARLFCKLDDVAIQPPCQRAEPEDGAMEQGSGLRQAVASCHMRHLVGKYAD